MTYTVPRFGNRAALNLSFTGLYEHTRDVRTFTSKRQEGSVQLSQRLSKSTTLLYRYTYRHVSVDESTLKITPFLIPLLAQPVRVGILSGNLIFDRRDDPVDPRKGMYNTVDLGLAEHFLGSQLNQTELRLPLIGDNIGGVLFHDAGNVYSNLGHLSFRFHQRDLQHFDYMVQAAGFGIRYRTPVGPIRVDLAYSINPPSFIGYNGSLQDLVNAGVRPCDTPGRCTPQSVSHFQFFFSIGQTF
jgi:outer membrane translocation and assembly module TamA